MNTSEHRFGIVSVFVLGIAFALATFVLWPAEASTLPPRPTVEPTPAPTEPPADTPSDSSRVESSQIVLKVDVWELEAVDSWQALWTVVQWQDGRGRWHDVTGWRGHLDALDGTTGTKVATPSHETDTLSKSGDSKISPRARKIPRSVTFP